jgi:hypothetical protein
MTLPTPKLVAGEGEGEGAEADEAGGAAAAAVAAVGRSAASGSAAHPHYSEQLVRMRVVNTVPYQSSPLTPPEPEQSLSDLGLGIESPQRRRRRLEPLLGRDGDARPGDATTGDATAADQDDDPEGARVFIVLGRLFKLGSGFDEFARRLLEADERAVIALIAERHRPWNARTWLRLRAALADDGSDGNATAAGGGRALWPRLLRRVRFVHYWNYERVLARAIAVVDTYPYGGCLTALEALSHGVPIITLPAPYLRGRFTAALYEQMRLYQSQQNLAPPQPRAGARAATALGGSRDAAKTAADDEDAPNNCCVARDVDELVRLSLLLATDRAHREHVVASIRGAYDSELHRNDEAADEWAAFFRRAAGPFLPP